MAETTYLLESVKTCLGVTSNFHDSLLSLYIQEVQLFMIDAGVSVDIVNSPDALGCITRGVADLWNNGAGQADLSSYFKYRVIQLASKAVS